MMITLFSAAYVAEVVRGGLQSVPAGQIEAGRALGLSPLTVTGRIVLPQALRNSIPALIGSFISLLKDVSLLVIIGLQEMLGMVDVVLARREFTNQGYTPRPTRSWASSTGRCASRCRGQRSDSRPDSE